MGANNSFKPKPLRGSARLNSGVRAHMRQARLSLLPLVLLAAACTPHSHGRGGSTEIPPAQQKTATSPLKPSEFSYQAEIVGYNEKGRHVEPIKQVPEHAVRFGSGVLMGSDRGEWGGELVYRSSRGEDTILLAQNVQGIYIRGRDALVFTGLAHMGMNDGAVYRVQTGARPKIRLVHKLIASPGEIVEVGSGFRTKMRMFEQPDPSQRPVRVIRCYNLDGKLSLAETACAELRPNNSSRPTRLRGAA
jgi:hypothetical protein